MKSILVIGGTGFFGKSILDFFQRGGLEIYGINEIIIVSRHVEEFKFKYPELISNNVKLIAMDISNCDSLPEADLIVHAAASTDSRDYQYDSIETNSNVEKSVVNFSEILIKNQVKSKIVYCSSGAVYGQQPSDIEAMDENFPFQDISSLAGYKRAYAQAKRNSEKVITELGRKGFNVSIARCFSFCGKYLPKDQHFAYGNFMSDAENGRIIEVKAKGLVYRSYMQADDLVNSIVRIVLFSQPSCPIFNVGSNVAIEIRDLASKIAKKYKVGVKIEAIDSHLIDRYVPNVSRLIQLESLDKI